MKKILTYSIFLFFVFLTTSQCLAQRNDNRSDRATNTIRGRVRYVNYLTPPDTFRSISGKVQLLKVPLPNNPGIIIYDTVSIDTAGNYEFVNVEPGIYFIVAYPNDDLEQDNSNTLNEFVFTFFPDTQNWHNAERIIFTAGGSKRTCNITAKKLNYVSNQIRVEGLVADSINTSIRIRNAVIYARVGPEYKGFAVSDSAGNYVMKSLPAGNYSFFVTRFGYRNQSRNVIVPMEGSGDFNFYLGRDTSYYISVEKISETLSGYKLHQNYPNPFNPETTIQFDIPRKLNVKLRIYNINGKIIAELFNGILSPGSYKAKFINKNLASGIYFYHMEVSDDNSIIISESKQMILLK